MVRAGFRFECCAGVLYHPHDILCLGIGETTHSIVGLRNPASNGEDRPHGYLVAETRCGLPASMPNATVLTGGEGTGDAGRAASARRRSGPSCRPRRTTCGGV